MKRNRYFTVLLCFILAAVLITGCGSSAGNEAADFAMKATEAAMAEPMADMSSSTGLSEYSDPNAKLIRTVYLDAQTQDYDALMTGLDEKITALDGYVESRDAYNGSETSGYSNRYCNLVIRIPADRLDEFVTHVNESFNVINTSETVENITLQYTDTASRVEALETEQTRLLELLEGAQNLTEILDIEARLSDVRYELNSYASQLRIMDNQVSYATVHLNVDEVKKLTPTEELTVWVRIREGLSETLENIGDFAVDFFVGFVVNLPWIAIIAVAGGIVFIIIRIADRKAKKKNPPAYKPPKQEPKEE